MTAVAASVIGTLVASLGVWPILGAVGACAYLLLPFRAILAVALGLAFYRLPTPSFPLGPELNLDLADLSIILFALRILLREAKLLFAATPTEWLLSLALSQSLGNALSIVTALSPIRSAAETMKSVMWAVVILGVARWLRAGSADDVFARLRFVFIMTITASLAAAIVALYPSALGLRLETLYAPLANGYAIRVSGVSGGFLSGLLIVGIVMATGFLRSEPRWRLPVTAVLLVLCATVWQTYTRGAIVDLVAVTALMFAWPRTPRSLTGRVMLCGLGVGALIVISFASGSTMRSRFEQLRAVPSGSTTLDTRKQLWGTAIEVFEKRPALGVGAGNFNQALRTYVPDRLPSEFYSIYHYPEQQLLGLMDETGAIGAATYLVSIVVLIHRLYLRSRLYRQGLITSRQGELVLVVLVVLTTRAASELAGTSLSGNDLLLVTSGLAIGITSGLRFSEVSDGKRDLIQERDSTAPENYIPGSTRPVRYYPATQGDLS